MTDSIPVPVTFRNSGDGWDIQITTDIARMIVAMGQPTREDKPAYTTPTIVPFHNCEFHGPTPNGMPWNEFMAQGRISDLYICARNMASKPVDAGPAALILNPHGPPAVGSGAGCRMTRATAPCDDAAVEFLLNLKWMDATGGMHPVMPYEGAAREVLAAIRRGDMPPFGVYGKPLRGENRSRILLAIGAENIDDGIAKIAATRAEVESLKDQVHTAQAAHHESCRRSNAEVAELTRERDEAREKQCAQLVSIMNQRDEARTELDSRKADLERMRGEYALTRAERDEARAELAALKARKVALPRGYTVKIESWGTVHFKASEDGDWLDAIAVRQAMAAAGVQVET